ncbi:MAG: hypothetical protein H7Y13_08245 [Sphingobacteriaceae bacterium]|nr:hypothetical protein [Sphingobacteriaceae bacterium]
MKSRKLYLITLLLPFMLLASSCSSNSAKADEPEVATMDSVSNGLNETNQQLDEKAKSLEASLEKADKELETAQ